jgi:RNA ligase
MSHFHPAKNYTFSDLHALLEQQVSLKTALKQVCPGPNPGDPDYVLYSYKSITTADWKGSPVLGLARGIVLDLANKTIVALPFEKFFNHYEHPPACRYKTWTITSIETKFDGSLGIGFYDARYGAWRICTRGSFKSSQARWGETMFLACPNLDKLDKDVTWLFEIICEESHVVVQYEEDHLRLLSGYRVSTFEQLSRSDVEKAAEVLQLPIVEQLPIISTSSIIEELLPSFRGIDCEGVVVQFMTPEGTFERRKFKGENYKALHAAKSDVSRARVLTVMSTAGDVDEAMKVITSFSTHMPEEHTDLILNWAKQIACNFEEFTLKLKADQDATAEMDPKTLGLTIKNPDKEDFVFQLPTQLRALLFSTRRGNSPAAKIWANC